jgi:hypothetical protein
MLMRSAFARRHETVVEGLDAEILQRLATLVRELG